MAVSIIAPIATVGSAIETQDFEGIFLLDATVSESHTNSAETLEHPVEQGANITDHIRTRPFEITINGIVTNTPVDPVELAREEELAAQDERTETRVQATYETMRATLEARTPVTVVTGLKVYQDMVLTSIIANRSAGGRQAIEVSMTLKQIRIVSSAVVAIPANVIARAQRSSGKPKDPKDQQGEDKTKKETEAKAEKRVSRLKAGLKTLADLVT